MQTPVNPSPAVTALHSEPRQPVVRPGRITERELRHRLRYSKSTMKRPRLRGMPYMGGGRLRRFHWTTVCDSLKARKG
jgi:hypothetical protein